MGVEPRVQIGKHFCPISGEFVINLMPQAFVELEGLVLGGDAVEQLLLP